MAVTMIIAIAARVAPREADLTMPNRITAAEIAEAARHAGMIPKTASAALAAKPISKNVAK